MNEKRDFQIEVLNNSNSLQEERIQALFQLMNIADDESLDAIFNCLRNDSCEIVRHEAAFVLGETASERAVIELKTAIVNDRSDVVKHEALLALGTISNEEIRDFLDQVYHDKDFSDFVRESAKVAIQRLNLNFEPYRGPKQFEHLN